MSSATPVCATLGVRVQGTVPAGAGSIQNTGASASLAYENVQPRSPGKWQRERKETTVSSARPDCERPFTRELTLVCGCLLVATERKESAQ